MAQKEELDYLKNLIDDTINRYKTPFDKDKIKSSICSIENLINRTRPLELLLCGRKLQHRKWNDTNKFIWRNPISRCIENENGEICDFYLKEILDNGHLFELYQEPKKAWIFTNDFVAKEFPILNDNSRSGAIALAREFLKRYKEANTNQNPRIRANVYTILDDLIGKENL